MVCHTILLSLFVLLGTDHRLRLHPLVELRLSEISQLERGLLQCQTLLVGVLGNGGSLVIADMRIERSHQHQRVIHELADPLGVRLDTRQTVLHEGLRPVAEKPDRVEDIVSDQRLENVELEVTAHATHRHRSLVAHHLSANHSQCLALRGVHLSRHDARSRLILWQVQLPEAGPGPAAEETDIVGDLEETDSDGVQRAVEINQSVLSGQRLELVGRSHEIITRLFADLLSNRLSKTDIGVETGSHSSTTLGEL